MVVSVRWFRQVVEAVGSRLDGAHRLALELIAEGEISPKADSFVRQWQVS